jgi:hypothetical protein
MEYRDAIVLEWGSMKRVLQIAGLTGIILLVSAGVARADTLQFVVSGQAGSATFSLQRNPTVTSFSGGNDFTVTVNNGSLYLMGYSYPAPPFVLEFSNTSAGGGFGLLVPYLGYLQLKGAQMFTGLDSAPSFSTGTYFFNSWLGLVTVNVTSTSVPEPSTLLLLGFGLVGLGLLRKR